MKDKPPKTLVPRQPDPQARVGRQFSIVLIVQVSLVVLLFIAGVIWQNSLNDEHSARAKTSACQYGYSVNLARVLQARSAVSERLRVAGATPQQLNAALDRHPYPKVPDCRR